MASSLNYFEKGPTLQEQKKCKKQQIKKSRLLMIL
jgi:hypothetical protein